MAVAEAKLKEAGLLKKVSKSPKKSATGKVRKEKVKKEPNRDLQAEKEALKEQRKLEKEVNRLKFYSANFTNVSQRIEIANKLYNLIIFFIETFGRGQKTTISNQRKRP